MNDIKLAALAVKGIVSELEPKDQNAYHLVLAQLKATVQANGDMGKVACTALALDLMAEAD